MIDNYELEIDRTKILVESYRGIIPDEEIHAIVKLLIFLKNKLHKQVDVNIQLYNQLQQYKILALQNKPCDFCTDENGCIEHMKSILSEVINKSTK
jgi:hypothetical protein